jgi:hypothetical protein
MSSKGFDYLPERDVKPRMLKPLPTHLRGIACCMCERMQSSWQTDWVTEDDNKVYLCSICIIYHTDWGRTERANIESVVVNIQKARGTEFDKDLSKRMMLARDADDVLGVVVLATRVAKAQNLAASMSALGMDADDE